MYDLLNLHCTTSPPYTVRLPQTTLYDFPNLHCMISPIYTVWSPQPTLYDLPNLHCAISPTCTARFPEPKLYDLPNLLCTTLSFRYFDDILPPYLSCCLSSYSSSGSLFFLSKTADCLKGQPEKCWCTVFSIADSTRLEFTAFENSICSSFSSFKFQLETHYIYCLLRRLSVKVAMMLWGSMIDKHTGRWMWQGSASVVSWSWEKYSCQSKLVSALSMLLLPVLSWRVSQAWNPHQL